MRSWCMGQYEALSFALCHLRRRKPEDGRKRRGGALRSNVEVRWFAKCVRLARRGAGDGRRRTAQRSGLPLGREGCRVCHLRYMNPYEGRERSMIVGITKYTCIITQVDIRSINSRVLQAMPRLSMRLLQRPGPLPLMLRGSSAPVTGGSSSISPRIAPRRTRLGYIHRANC